MKIKNIVPYILLLVLAASMAACGGTDSFTPIAQAVTTESGAAVGNEEAEDAYLPTIIADTDIEDDNLTFPIVDTNQGLCYDSTSMIDCPAEDEAFYGQDAQYSGNAASYTYNGDGTVTDNVTGLVWRQDTDTDDDGDMDAADKLSAANADAYCEASTYAGYDDWILPTIKQLYSLMDFSGMDPSGYEGTDTSGLVPFIDTDYFDFAYGDTDAGERIIDSQYASSTYYVSDEDDELLFGVNFADGRIKGYGLTLHGSDKTFNVACMRENDSYGVNDFVDNGDGTITDNATSLMWSQDDSGADAPDGLNWEEALAYVEAQNETNYLGYSNWRLPNVKELQSIVDYDRSPDTIGSAAIDPLFNATIVPNEEGEADYDFYWSGTTHANWTSDSGSAGAYVSFGRGLGYMGDEWVDIHGAGSQRSDPKTGDPDDYPTGRGPQGDAIRIYNTGRLVRGDDVTETVDGDPNADSTVPSADLVTSSVSAETTDAAAPEGMDDQQMPDLAAAADQLGVTEEQLMETLGEPGQGPPDFAAAAEALGVTLEELVAAIGVADQPPSNTP
jgi:hypothetical protein